MWTSGALAGRDSAQDDFPPVVDLTSLGVAQDEVGLVDEHRVPFVPAHVGMVLEGSHEGADAPDRRLRPGTSAQIVVSGRDLEDALYVPPQAIFEKDGQLTVYVRENAAFVPRTVTVVGNSTGRVAIEGVAEGDDVALVDPFGDNRTSSAVAVPGVES